ncbi:MAG: hypothetical protein QXJ21_07380 [Thermofilum sp.]
MPTTCAQQPAPLIASFVEGCTAPYVELVSSTLLLTLHEMLQGMSTLSPFDTSCSIWLSAGFLYKVVATFTILELLRNIVTGLVYPGNALAEAVGAVASLLLLARAAPPIQPAAAALAEILRDTYCSTALTTVTLLLGPLTRYAVSGL